MRRKNGIGFVNFIWIIVITAAAVKAGAAYVLNAEASTVSEVESSIRAHQQELEQKEGEVSALEEEQDLLLEKMEDLNAEIINTMASIELKQDEIAEKEEQIKEKEAQIQVTAEEYEAAKAQEEAQKQDMAARTRLLYEQGETTYMSALLQGQGFSDVLNRMDYIERIYEYSKMKLDDYIETKNQIQDLWDQLEEEKASLQQDETQLQADEAELEAQKSDLNVMLGKLKAESANYDALIQKARQEAAVVKTLLQQDQQKLKDLKAAQAAANAASGTYSTDYNSVIDSASGSELGKQIARFACQYVGNPYVAGGSSLTSGADCSGFTYRVYQNFGYDLPRTSTQQRSVGSGVSYDEAQPGDLICYDGHVAIYIGNGQIVHASNSNPYPRGGIKVGNAQYRPILTVRRIV